MNSNLINNTNMNKTNNNLAKSFNKYKFSSDLTEDQKLEIKESFEIFDSNKKGAIEAKELNLILKALDFNCSEEEVNKMLIEIDKNENSILNFEEFAEILTFKMLERDPIVEIRNKFKLLCDENKVITIDSLKAVVDELGENMKLDELNEIIKESSNDGKIITEDDFVNFMKSHINVNLGNI